MTYTRFEGVILSSRDGITYTAVVSDGKRTHLLAGSLEELVEWLEAHPLAR